MMKNTISHNTDGYIFSEDDWSADEEWVAESRRRARKKKELERQRRLYAHLLAAAAVLFAAIVLVLVWGAFNGAFRSWGKQSAGASVFGTGNPAATIPTMRILVNQINWTLSSITVSDIAD